MDERPDRLLAQRLLFAAPVAEAPDGLYVQGDPSLDRTRDTITVPAGGQVTTNTYFGRFPASYWQRWTEVPEVDLVTCCTGTGELRLVASDPDGRPRVVRAVEVIADHPREVALTAPLDRFVDGGGLWLDLRGTHGPLTVAHARWTVPAPVFRRPTAVVMPSYNRVGYCIDTLLNLARDREVLDLLATVHLVDQGSDPVDRSAVFPQVVDLLGGKLRYLRQPNLGGSGGYSRGLAEAIKHHGGHVNALFLDDDIWLEPDVVIRLSAFEQHTRKPVIVGGQMLRLLHPDRLHVGAETVDLDTLVAGEPVERALVNAAMVDDTGMPPGRRSGAGRETRRPPFQQETRVDAGYNGWWACLVPGEVVRNVGYPLPAFFQWDDIEYGLRARDRGYPTVTLPGAGVWHADFDWKDWDDWHRYFNIRNSMITAALHGGFDRRSVTISLLQQLLRYLAAMQYGLAATLLKSVEDFLAGPDVLRDGGVRAAGDVRTLRAEYPETVLHPAANVPGVDLGRTPLVPSGRPPLLRRPLLLARLARQWRGQVDGAAAIPAGSAYWWHVSNYATAVVTDASQEGVRVRRLDAERLHRLARRGIAVLARLYREGPAVAARYRAELPGLTSPENWQRLYGANQEVRTG